jgi:hypothetical protein
MVCHCRQTLVRAFSHNRLMNDSVALLVASAISAVVAMLVVTLQSLLERRRRGSGWARTRMCRWRLGGPLVRFRGRPRRLNRRLVLVARMAGGSGQTIDG